ncbi:hypothetical protein OH693_19385 [Escherichia coli]|nr:hypothetical protein [Escherichia coli]
MAAISNCRRNVCRSFCGAGLRSVGADPAGASEELNKTWQTQPALLTASVALYRVWQQQGGKAPAMMAGHSLGNTPRWFALV